MGRIVGLWLLTAAALAAQDQPAGTLAQLQDAAGRKAVEWDTQAQGLNRKIARLLPCDLRVRGAIEEVSRASEARLAAIEQYLHAAVQEAKDHSDQTRLLISNQETSAAALNTERTEAEEELAAIDGQLGDLQESAKQRTQLEDPEKALAAIAGMAHQRATEAHEQADRNAALTASLQELDQRYQKQQAALENELTALTAETARWSEYYAARLKRAQTECAITNGARSFVPPAPGGKKQ